VAATATAVDKNTVEVVFTEVLVPNSVDLATLGVVAPFDGPDAALNVTDLRIEGDRLVLTTDDQVGGRAYAARLGALAFEGVSSPDSPSQVSFAGWGLASVTISMDTTGHTVGGDLDAMATIDPATGAFTQQFHSYPMTDGDGDGIYTATIDARIERAAVYAARAVDAAGAPAGTLKSFTVRSLDGATVALDPLLPDLPEFDPPVDMNVGDNKAPVRIVFDDRFARVLTQPALRLSVDANGNFDLSTQRVDTAQPVPGKPRVYEVIVEVAVDPTRVPEGMDSATFPYVSFLVEAGEDIPQRGATFVMPDETPQVIVVPIGNPALVPVTFRVDAASAVLEPDLGLRGMYPGEGLFLTGEFPAAEDALGRLAADAFSGGERATLEMKPRPDAPAIFEKVVFMQPNRPYGWKVVRCPTGVGCSELNRHVSSSGRAFPTVMKNLVTKHADGANDTGVTVVDPAALDAVMLPDGTVANYAAARVSSDGSESASTAVLFKQETPDLVVNVATEPVITPTYVIGTWRDVNIAMRPSEVVAQGATLELAETDYDDGFVGAPALLREHQLPLDPGMVMRQPGEPAFTATDGALDASAMTLASGGGRLPMHVSWNGDVLYVATEPASMGQDHFIYVSAVEPSTTGPAHWAKGGTAPTSDAMVFLAMEGDGNFDGWFQRSAAGTDTALDVVAVTSAGGGVLEGAIDLDGAGLQHSGKVWIGVVAYGTGDGDGLLPSQQRPEGDGDFDFDASEMVQVELDSIRAL